VVSVAEHAGWAHLVCVATADTVLADTVLADTVPAVIERRRVTLIDAGVPTQPYHHESLGMKEDEANALIARVKRSVASRTARALQRVVTDLSPAYTVVALAIREPPFSELPATVSAVWESYRLQCAADGMLYQLAICRAARELEWDVYQCPRGEETARAAARLGVTPEDIETFINGIGRPSGPPWTGEHRRAYATGIAALAAHARAQTIRVPRA
jgi:hypothetical protein